MAEPAGLLIRTRIADVRLNAFFRSRIVHGSGQATIGHVLAEQLDRSDERGDVLIVNHDATTGELFLAWILNHYSQEAIASIWPVLDVLAAHADREAEGRGAVATVLPECLASLRMHGGRLLRETAEALPEAALESLTAQLWSFARKDSFPAAAAGMRRRDYQCKPFKRAWKTYLAWRDKQERPARIAAATEAEPYRLFDDIVCWPGTVAQRDAYTRRDIPFPDADPLSFRNEAGFYADRHHVWQRRLAKDSPPAEVKTTRGTINNPAAIWEYHIVADAIGADFTWFDDRWDTLFWTDKRRVYARDHTQGLMPLPGIDASRFRMCGQCFGTDGNTVFYGTTRLPLDPGKLKTETYFLWDDRKVFMTDRELPLEGRTFRILGHKHVPLGGRHYRLADASKTIVLGPNHDVLPDDPAFWM